MGFYIRKSISLGPIRYNLSKSGVGISGGVKGFRVGSGPSGNYVHMGRGGVYYRQFFRPAKGKGIQEPREQPNFLGGQVNLDVMQPIDSDDVANMVDASSRELLEEINRKRNKQSAVYYIFLLLILTALILIIAKLPEIAWIVWLTLGAVISIITHYVDKVSKTVVVFYELEESAESAYQALHSAFDWLKESSKVWLIEAEGNVSDTKYHAGATGLVNRKVINLSNDQIPFFKANINFPILPAGRQILVFLPDKVLVFAKEGVGAISYADVEIAVNATRFIEVKIVPEDTEVVDQTWRYVNKNGGPDKRFRDNPQIPVVMYEELHFTSGSGLNEMYQVSRIGGGDLLSAAIRGLSKATSLSEPSTTSGCST